MHQQINKYFESLLSKFQCGFRQGFSAQHCLLVMVEKMKKFRDNKGVFAAVLSDLSSVFDCIPHGLLIAKLNAFGFDKKSVPFIIYNRKQKKVDPEFSEFLDFCCSTGINFRTSYLYAQELIKNLVLYQEYQNTCA